MLARTLVFSSFVLAALASAVSAQVAPLTGPTPQPAQAEQPKYPTLQLVSPRLDFGTHGALSFLSETMTFVNSGTKPITLERAQGECSCTDATILGNTTDIPPGEKIEVLVAVEFPREAGLYSKNVLIYEKGNPVPFPVPFDFEVGYPILINGGPRYAIVNEPGGQVTLKSRTDTPFSVRSISGMAPMYDSFDPAKDPPRTEYTVFYKFETVNALELPRWLIIETDHPDAEMMAIPARFRGYDSFIDKTKWHAMDEFITLGTISAKGPTRTSMLFTGKAVQPGKRILVKSGNPNLGVQVANVRRPDRGGGMQIDFDVYPSPHAKGFQSAIVTIDYDDASARFDIFCRLDPDLPAPPVPNR